MSFTSWAIFIHLKERAMLVEMHWRLKVRIDPFLAPVAAPEAAPPKPAAQALLRLAWACPKPLKAILAGYHAATASCQTNEEKD